MGLHASCRFFAAKPGRASEPECFFHLAKEPSRPENRSTEKTARERKRQKLMKEVMFLALQAFVVTLIVAALVAGFLGALSGNEECSCPCWFVACGH